MIKQIPFGKCYFISNDGVIFTNRNGTLEPIKNKKGEYYNRSVTLHDAEKKILKSFCVDFLVAQAFIPNPLNFKFVSHKDGNSYNNSVSNLYWAEKRKYKKRLGEETDIKLSIDLSQGIKVDKNKYRNTKSICWDCTRSAAPKDIRCSWDAELRIPKGAKYYIGSIDRSTVNIAPTIVECPLFDNLRERKHENRTAEISY